MRAYAIFGVLLMACSGGGAERPPQQPTPTTTAVADAAVPPAVVPVPTAVVDEPDDMSAAERQAEDEALLEAFVDEACACADLACYNEANERMAQKTAHRAAESRPPSEKMRELAAKFSQCLMVLTEAEPASP